MLCAEILSKINYKIWDDFKTPSIIQSDLSCDFVSQGEV